MARKPEQLLWDRLSDSVPKDIWLQRVENVVLEGMPDVHGIVRPGVGFWIELKATEWPAKPTTAFLRPDSRLSVEQVNWHLDYAKFGGLSFVLVGVGRGRDRGWFLYAGKQVEHLNVVAAEHASKLAIARGLPDVFGHLKSC